MVSEELKKKNRQIWDEGWQQFFIVLIAILNFKTIFTYILYSSDVDFQFYKPSMGLFIRKIFHISIM